MRIASATIAENSIRQIQRLSGQQVELQNQVSTRQKITDPSDNPAAMSRILNLEHERRGLTQFTANTDRALQISQASYTGLQQLKKISDRATEIGTLSSSTTGADAREAYATEIDQLLEQAVQLGNTRFRNDYIFAGTAIDTQPFNVTRNAGGEITGVTYAGNSDQAEIPLSESTRVATGTAGTTNTGIGDFVNQLVALRDALRAGDSTAIGSAQQQLIVAEDVLVDSLSEQGAIQMRIEVAKTQQASRATNLEQLVSSEADVDLATTIVKLNQTQVAYQAALQSSANIMKLSLLDYIS